MGKFGRSHTKREETRMKTEADTGVKLRLERCGCQPGNPRIASDPRRTKRDRKGPLSEPESLALPTPRSWTFGLQTCERPHFCCLKLPVCGTLFRQPQEIHTAHRKSCQTHTLPEASVIEGGPGLILETTVQSVFVRSSHNSSSTPAPRTVRWEVLWTSPTHRKKKWRLNRH